MRGALFSRLLLARKGRLCYTLVEVKDMSKEAQKDFNAMLHRENGMPKLQIVTDPAVIARYGGARMFFAPALAYDEIMRRVPAGRVLTVGAIRDYLARQNGADFTDPMTAGIFISIAAWASSQRGEDPTPYWRTLKAAGELNPKYPGGVQDQKAKLEAEGHTVIQRGRTHMRYFVKDYEAVLFQLT